MVGILAGSYPAPDGVGRIGTQHVIRGLQIVEPQSFHRLGIVTNLNSTSANIGDRDCCAYLHLLSFLGG